MAATLAPTSIRTLELAIKRLTPGSVAYDLVATELDEAYAHREEIYAEGGYLRMRENVGFDEARGQEQYEAMMGITA